MYNDAAEYFAEDDRGGEDMEVDEVFKRQSFIIDGWREWVVGRATGQSKMCEALAGVVKKVPEESFVDIYEQIIVFCEEEGLVEHECPSYCTMIREFNENWKGSIKFIPVGTHSKCSMCAAFKQWRLVACSHEDHTLVRRNYHDHLKIPTAIRRIDEALSKDSEDYAAGKSVETPPLRAHQDAVDQAKLKIPKKWSKGKDFATLWRPQLQLIGSLAFGTVHASYVMDCDVKKDANLEITVASRTLQHASKEYEQRGLAVPQIYGLHIDNAR